MYSWLLPKSFGVGVVVPAPRCTMAGVEVAAIGTLLVQQDVSGIVIIVVQPIAEHARSSTQADDDGFGHGDA